MLLNSHTELGQLVTDVVSGIRVERWLRTPPDAQPRVIPPPSLWPSDCFPSQIMSSDRSMKVGTATPATAAAKPVAKKPFGEVLNQQPAKPGLIVEQAKSKTRPMPPPLPSAKVLGPIAATISGIKATSAAIGTLSPHAATAENFSQARAGMNAEAGRLGQVRTEAHTVHEHRVDARVLDLIVKELCVEVATEGSKPATNVAAGALSTLGVHPETVPAKADAGQPAPGQKAKAAAALVERIETFVKSNRPALAVSLSGAINARVEVERTGPGEVSLRVQGTKGPPHAEDLARIREAIRERGLKLTSLSVG